MKCKTRKYADGGGVGPLPKGGGVGPLPEPKRPLPVQTDEELDKISPEALRLMQQKKDDIEQERRQRQMEESIRPTPMKKGGTVKKSGASKRGDGIAQRGKTKGRFV